MVESLLARRMRRCLGSFKSRIGIERGIDTGPDGRRLILHEIVGDGVLGRAKGLASRRHKPLPLGVRLVFVQKPELPQTTLPHNQRA